MRPRKNAAFATATRHTYSLELVLDFDAPLTAFQAKEVARRIVDALQLSTEPVGRSEGLQSARVTCHALRRSLPLELPPQVLPLAQDRGDALS